MKRALVFGASGQIGAECATAIERVGMQPVRTSRRGDDAAGIVAFDPFRPGAALPGGRFDAVVWAQGANLNDSLFDWDAEAHLHLYKANVLFVAETMARLLSQDQLEQGARLVVVSSVWQTVARPRKLSYMVSKAALQGLVLSAAVDLAERNILVNAVLPGALDTPMTHANLSAQQIASLAGMTPFGRLPAIQDVGALAAFLASPANSSISGQFVAVDLGFQNARLV